MKHITEYSYEKGHAFNGFRVSILKKGIGFMKYISSKKIGREAALEEAIRVHDELVEELKECRTLEEIVEFKKIWDN